VLLGDLKAELRTYVFGGRDRMDESSDDFIRTARSKRYRYIRNFTPDVPYAQRVEYGEKMPIMQQWRSFHAEGKLAGAQKLFFQHPKPQEELYDIIADQHEVNNLAGCPDHQDVLRQMRRALAEWMQETSDLGGLDEAKLIERMWPSRKQPTTAPPAVRSTPAPGGRISIETTCSTEGASIGYRLGRTDRWEVYTSPILVEPGTTLEAKAIRLGYRQSETVRRQF